MELKWYCAWCDQHLTMKYSGVRLPMKKSPKQAAAERLWFKVEGHIDFHTWQFGNEIDSWWLEEQEEE